MAIPFEKDIPYFPGESKHALPTEATTIFNNPKIATGLELASQYISGQTTAKQRERILRELVNQVAHDSDNQVYQTISDLQESASANSIGPGSQERATAYAWLKDKINEEVGVDLPTPQKRPIPFVRSASTAVDLPTRSRIEIPSNAIALVNLSLQTTFPDEFGTIIPPLHQSDIHVSNDRDQMAYQKRIENAELHSFYVAQAKLLHKRLGLPENDTAEQVIIHVAPFLPGNPVFFPESEIIETMQHPKARPEVKQIILEGITAKTLIHESFHRATKQWDAIPVKPDDPLFTLAFATADHMMETAEQPKEKAAWTEMNDSLKAYAVEHGAAVRIDGTRVTLLSPDEDGEAKALLTSGYDLQEAIVENLAYHSLKPLLAYLYKNYPADLVKKVVAVLTEHRDSDSTYHIQNITDRALPYVKSIGLKTPQALLRGFTQGSIPLLHIKKKPQEAYFF